MDIDFEVNRSNLIIYEHFQIYEGDFPQVLELYKEVKQLPLEKPPSIAYNILINTFAKLKKI